MFKIYFLYFWKIIMGSIYIKKNKNYWNKFLYFESCNHKKFHANSLCFKSSFICLKHSKKRTWIIDFIFSKVFFPYQMCTKCFRILLNSNVLHMKGFVFPNHLKIFYKCVLSDFDTWTCLIIIIVLNLWSWLKI